MMIYSFALISSQYYTKQHLVKSLGEPQDRNGLVLSTFFPSTEHSVWHVINIHWFFFNERNNKWLHTWLSANLFPLWFPQISGKQWCDGGEGGQGYFQGHSYYSEVCDKSDHILTNSELMKHRGLGYSCGTCHHGIQVPAWIQVSNSVRECERDKMPQNLQTQRER